MELFLTIRQEAKAKNAFANNMSTDIKLSKPKVPKIIQSYRFLGNIIANLCKKKKNRTCRFFDLKYFA